MKIEATQPLTIQRPTGRIDLQPGHPIDLPDAAAVELIHKAGGRVLPVPVPGQCVRWRSPALPSSCGELLAVHENGWMDVFHPLTEAVARLPLSWLTV